MISRVAWVVSMVLLTGCLESYTPPIEPTDVNILVVDGSLDTSEGHAMITLTRGVALSQPDSFPSVTGAFVAVEDGQGNTYPLAEGAAGQYEATGIPIEADAQYRLHIITQENYEYYSDVVTPRFTPPIDSVTWTTDDEKLTIAVNTHDDTQRSKYYRWSFVETWNYHAATLSLYKVVGKEIVARKPDELTFYCWRTQPSTQIIIGSTARLSSDVVSRQPVQFIQAGSKKLQIKYSLLVRQRVVSEDEYNYLEQLKKTTESIGGLFDPQPGQVTGNVHRVKPESPVAVGFFGAGNTVQQRIFINTAGLPRAFREIYPRLGCYPPDTVCVVPNVFQCVINSTALHEGFILGTELEDGAAYTLTSAPCSDCRLEGGVLTKPDFWP